ncbi:hypothetical protein [Enterococcus rivorum]|uniref:Uncharacterized protein n=2 Tax=Enterococcus rivorum TaxID=762845 RepID=A0A1E5KU73_9ENTE|nr:hypothetical protein [Enterococcus rivorum]OEH81308.1 hypothetical protein BCR26_17195 [Enterococcus rivorum]
MEKSKKNRGIMITGIIAAMMLIAGTFAWTAFSQRALNENEGKNANMGGRIHDDYHKKSGNKDIYAENFGKKDLLVRIKLSEYFEGNGEPLVGKTSKDDRASWIPYSLPVKELADDPYRAYVNWELGGDKVFLPTFNMDNQSLETDAAGDAIDFIVNGPTNLVLNEKGQLNDGTQDFFIEGEAYTNPDDSNSTQTAKKTLPGTQDPISMESWKNLPKKDQKGNYWVIDTDGWAYWAQLLEPKESTSLLLNQLNYEEEALYDFDSWYYGIDVIGEFTTVEDADKFEESEHGKASSDAQNLIKAITPQEEVFTYELEFTHKNAGESIEMNSQEKKEFSAKVSKISSLNGKVSENTNVSWFVDKTDAASITDIDEGKGELKTKSVSENTVVKVTATANDDATVTESFDLMVKPFTIGKLATVFNFYGEDYLHLKAFDDGNHLIQKVFIKGINDLPKGKSSSEYNNSDLDVSMKEFYNNMDPVAQDFVQPVQKEFKVGEAKVLGGGSVADLTDSFKADLLDIDSQNDLAVYTPSGEKKAFAMSAAELNNLQSASGELLQNRTERARMHSNTNQVFLRTASGGKSISTSYGDAKLLTLATSNTSPAIPTLVIRTP